MPEPISYYGVFLASGLCHTHNNNLEKRIGGPCGYMRRGIKDNLLYKADRVLDYAASRKLWPEPDHQPTYYLMSEAWRLVGVTEKTLKRILGDREPPAILIPDQAAQPFNLWPEPMLMEIRRAISIGEIPVRPSSLTKPKLGVNVCRPRHTQAADQNAEAEAYKRANPYAGIRW